MVPNSVLYQMWQAASMLLHTPTQGEMTSNPQVSKFTLFILLYLCWIKCSFVSVALLFSAWRHSAIATTIRAVVEPRFPQPLVPCGRERPSVCIKVANDMIFLTCTRTGLLHKVGFGTQPQLAFKDYPHLEGDKVQRTYLCRQFDQWRRIPAFICVLARRMHTPREGLRKARMFCVGNRHGRRLIHFEGSVGVTLSRGQNITVTPTLQSRDVVGRDVQTHAGRLQLCPAISAPRQWTSGRLYRRCSSHKAREIEYIRAVVTCGRIVPSMPSVLEIFVGHLAKLLCNWAF